MRHYIDKKMGCPEIAKLVNRHPHRVLDWLKDFGIPTRPRGHDTSQLIKDGSVWLGRSHSVETKAKMREIALADGRVPYDPKVGSYMKGRSGETHPQWKGGITPERQALYSSKEWIQCVEGVWKRAKNKCERCGKKHDPKNRKFHIHHIVKFAVKELRTTLSNLVLLCSGCHGFVHSRKNVNKEFVKTYES